MIQHAKRSFFNLKHAHRAHSSALHTMMEGKNEDARKVTGLVTEIQDADKCSNEMLHYRNQLNHVKHRL